ncbi:MAG: phage virion morphogenesis protein [Leptolyngbya sp. SIO1E4]|nr:phage virion morphogenesis protein [Leptolyngbya sp. SIO1E4]
MFDIETEADGVLRVLADTEDRLRNWRPALNEAALYMEREVKQNFLKQEDPDGNPWVPLAQSTLEQKRKRKAPLVILRDTASLVSGIAARPASDTQASVETTAGAEYGIWHQLGTEKMPQRRYMGFSQRHIDAIELIMVGYVEG